MSLKLILARHGASAAYDNIDTDEDVFRQTKSTPLRQLGTNQAHQLGKQVSIYQPDVLLCSPYTRARQTAEIVTKYSPQLFPNVIEDLSEIKRVVDGHSIYSQLNLDYKKWRGEAIRKADLKSKFHPRDDSFGEFFDQITKLKHWITKEFDNQTVLAIGHSQSFAMFITSALLGDKPAPTALFSSFNKHFMNHCAISILTYDYRKGWQMKESDFNITTHLN